jgi:hypothetical protein
LDDPDVVDSEDLVLKYVKASPGQDFMVRGKGRERRERGGLERCRIEEREREGGG